MNKADKQSELRFEEPLTAGVTDLSWNRKVPHIVAVASSAGKVSILDLRSRKAVASFTPPEPESSVSSLSWSPSNTTSIIVSNSSDNSPHLYNWDLKAPNAAQMTFSGHSSGVLSTFWSIFQDYDVLLSSSKDGSVISWNTADGSLIKQLEKRDSSVFKVTLCPDNSGLYASCGLDEKVNIFSYQDLLHADQEQTGTKVPSEDIVFNSAELSTSPSSESSIGEDSTTNDDPAHAQSPNSAKGEQGIPPIDVALGTGSICSIFSSGLRDAALVKAVSDECRAVSEEVSAFENMLANTDPGSACKTLIGPEADGRVWRLVSVLFAQDFNNELLEFIEAAHHHYSTGQQSTQLSLKTGSFDIVPLNEVDADEVIKEKLIEFDIHGAVSACLSANRHTDALIIASCHGPELRDEVESYIFKHSSSPYMKIACALRLRDFTDLIDDSSDDNWKQILSLLIHHSDPEKFVESCLRLAERLSSFKSEEAYLASATSFLVAGDLYRFAEQLLAGLIKDDDSHSESDLKCQCSSVFTAYRFIRFMQFYSYEFLSSITDEKLKNRILDVILKMKYILLLSGSESIISEDFTQFSSQFIDQDVNLDLLIEKLFVFNESHDYVAQSGVPQVDEVQPIPPSIQPQPTVEGLGYPSIINPAEAAIVNPTHMTQPIEPAIFDAAQPSQAVFDGLIQPVPPTAALAPNFAAPAAQIHSALPVMSPPQLVQPNPPPISPTWSPEGSPATYNDAPIINPRGFALTPDITSKIGSLSIAGKFESRVWIAFLSTSLLYVALDENEIQNAIQVLISTADQKSQVS